MQTAGTAGVELDGRKGVGSSSGRGTAYLSVSSGVGTDEQFDVMEEVDFSGGMGRDGGTAIDVSLHSEGQEEEEEEGGKEEMKEGEFEFEQSPIDEEASAV